jgi:hypothetical protein
MRWNNSAWALLQHVEFVWQEKELATGRAEKLTRKKTSFYQFNLIDSYAATSSPIGTFLHT